MTEDEAKTKTCCGPKLVLLGLLATTGKKISDPVGPTLCLGSTCMGWRWQPVLARHEGTAVVFQYPSPTPTDGFCGLAGKP